MNLPNKLTMLRIVMAFIIIAVLLFPFDAMGVENPPVFGRMATKDGSACR